MSQNQTIKKIRMNLGFSLIGQVVTLLLGIIIPKLFIESYGSEFNGYISSINQVFTYIALLEAGVGAASLQSLYKPCGETDRGRISAILSATHRYYTRTGFFYLGVMLLCAFLYPLIVKENGLAYSDMVLLFVIMGAKGAIPYFTYAKYKVLFRAEGKNYFITNAATIIDILLALSRAILLSLGLNIFLVQSLYLMANIIHALVYAVYIKKNYPWLNLKAQPDYGAISQKNSVLVHQVSTLIFNNTDVLFLSIFLDLNAASIYTMYKMLINIVASVITNLTDGTSFRLGQIFHERERFLKYHDIYETLHLGVTFALMSVTLVCFTPFLKLYTAEMDINYIVPFMPLCIVILDILHCGRLPSGNIITFAGKFKETTYRSVLESVINIVFTAIFAYFFGIIGVLMGTVVALLYRTNDIIIYTNRSILRRSCWPVYRQWLINIVLSLGFLALVRYVFPVPGDSYVSLILWAAVAAVILLPLQVGIGILFNGKVRRDVWAILCKKKRQAP